IGIGERHPRLFIHRRGFVARNRDSEDEPAMDDGAAAGRPLARKADDHVRLLAVPNFELSHSSLSAEMKKGGRSAALSLKVLGI
ncbi:MAG TPA: hypothetical protein VFK79_17570, partial [Xanthobacteraceae bacterium]|nr:hypothetical protein [Xanthobacteraceae bacterium]